MVELVIVDSNVWIFSEAGAFEEHAAAEQKIKEVLSSGMLGINSIIVSEVYHKLWKLLGQDEAHYRVKRILKHPLIRWLDISIDMAVNAIDLSLERHIRGNDSLIAQQALELGVPILTDDTKDFGKVKNLKIIPLR